MEEEKTGFFRNLNKKYGKKLKMISDSATFALLLSIALFMYEMISSTNETKQIVDNLSQIENSLSTRHLGIFPEYINSINGLLNEAIDNQNKSTTRDSVIIFEDVVYYGIRSDAQGFRKMIENLLTLSHNGCHITMAFYDTKSMPFRQMIRDKMLFDEYQNQYSADMRSYRERIMKLRSESAKITDDKGQAEMDAQMKILINKHFDNVLKNPISSDSLHRFIRHIYNYSLVDSILSQKYYEQTRKAHSKRFITTKKAFLEPLPQKAEAVDEISIRVNNLFTKLDNIKLHYMNKDYTEITYSDYYNMYAELSNTICEVLDNQPNLEMIHLQESLMMCCWMTTVNGKEKAIIAFPSKYSTDEIGFISQDVAIAKYIHTMLNGIKKGRNTNDISDTN